MELGFLIRKLNTVYTRNTLIQDSLWDTSAQDIHVTLNLNSTNELS